MHQPKIISVHHETSGLFLLGVVFWLLPSSPDCLFTVVAHETLFFYRQIGKRQEIQLLLGSMCKAYMCQYLLPISGHFHWSVEILNNDICLIMLLRPSRLLSSQFIVPPAASILLLHEILTQVGHGSPFSWKTFMISVCLSDMWPQFIGPLPLLQPLAMVTCMLRIPRKWYLTSSTCFLILV